MATTSSSGAVGNGSGLIQSLGIGSGLNVQSLVTQLVTAERAPGDSRIARATQTAATQVSALGTLKGALATFQSALTALTGTAQLQSNSATSADNSVFTASATGSAVGGSYNISVQQLAQPQQLISTAYVGGAAAVVGTGTLQLQLGAKSFSVAIGSTANTLADVRDAINNASDNPGVKATLIYGTTGAQLVLTTASSGAANTIKVTANGDAGLAQLGYSGAGDPHYTEAQKAQDAIVLVSGVEVHSASNTVTTAIDGVTLNLVTAKKDTPLTLAVATNQSAMVANVQSLVTAYNKMAGQFSSLGSYDAASQTGGPMLGDWMLSDISAKINQGMTGTVSGLASNYSSLAAVGITTQADGTLAVDATKLQAALTADSASVSRLFSGSAGIATRLNTAVTAMLSSGGAIAARNDNLTITQKDLADQTTALNNQMALVQQRYLTQFNALDTLMSQMQSTSSYLTQQLASASQIANYTTSPNK
jgi:flagellar hook-associated protein 2